MKSSEGCPLCLSTGSHERYCPSNSIENRLRAYADKLKPADSVTDPDLRMYIWCVREDLMRILSGLPPWA